MYKNLKLFIFSRLDLNFFAISISLDELILARDYLQTMHLIDMI